MTKSKIDCLMCGTCCTAFDIKEIDKKAGERCKYLSADNKCTIYEKRPWGCKGYKPDELCVLVDSLDDEQKVRVFRNIYDV
ncbi:MAG: zinc/iron-chelating domain-containing protein [Denitrovibrio sp.]|nr:MAG: zinc/iron-chelating domain-containing protein [Denitrovibrio sp.]